MMHPIRFQHLLYFFSAFLFLSHGFILQAFALPAGFVYLHDIDSSILQDMRYAGYHNFMGRPVKGYERRTCILTKEAAFALKKVQHLLRPFSYSLKVYDCYRPVQASKDFLAWSKDSLDQKMKLEFYPRINKALLFKKGYIAARSGHNRGSTVDLTIVPLGAASRVVYYAKKPLRSCILPYGERFDDNSIDMGTGYDCLDELSHVDNPAIKRSARHNRLFLRELMLKNGFVPYQKEWWHFTLKHEPYPSTYFHFTVR